MRGKTLLFSYSRNWRLSDAFTIHKLYANKSLSDPRLYSTIDYVCKKKRSTLARWRSTKHYLFSPSSLFFVPSIMLWKSREEVNSISFRWVLYLKSSSPLSSTLRRTFSSYLDSLRDARSFPFDGGDGGVIKAPEMTWTIIKPGAHTAYDSKTRWDWHDLKIKRLDNTLMNLV